MSTVWLVGRIGGSAAARTVTVLPRLFQTVTLKHFDRPAAAARARAGAPDLVFVVQHRPREFSADEADEFVSTHPVARFIIALGPWCSSHARRERVWPSAATVPLDRALLRLEREVELLSRQAPPVPLTAAVEEIFTAEAGDHLLPCGEIVAIDTPDTAFRCLLAELIERAGRTAVVGNPPPGATLLWDADPITDAGLQRLAVVRSRSAPQRVVAMTGSPCDIEDSVLWRAVADRVLPKPFLAGDLVAALTGAL